MQDGISPPKMDGLNEAAGVEETGENPFGEPEEPKKPKAKLSLRRRSLSSVSSLVEGLKVLPLHCVLWKSKQREPQQRQQPRRGPHCAAFESSPLANETA